MYIWPYTHTYTHSPHICMHAYTCKWRNVFTCLYTPTYIPIGIKMYTVLYIYTLLYTYPYHKYTYIQIHICIHASMDHTNEQIHPHTTIFIHTSIFTNIYTHTYIWSIASTCPCMQVYTETLIYIGTHKDILLSVLTTQNPITVLLYKSIIWWLSEYNWSRLCIGVRHHISIARSDTWSYVKCNIKESFPTACLAWEACIPSIIHSSSPTLAPPTGWKPEEVTGPQGKNISPGSQSPCHRQHAAPTSFSRCLGIH